MRGRFRFTTAVLVAASLISISGASAAAPRADAGELASRALAALPAEEGAAAVTQADSVSRGGITITGLAGEDTVSRSTKGGGQVLTVLRNAEDAAVFDVDLPPGAHLTKMGDSVLIAGKDQLLGAIDAPWAIDAKGKSLETSYLIKGNRLIQEVDTAAAAFPVVADPSFRWCDWYTSICMKLGYSETRYITDTFFVGVGAATAALCSLIPWMPPYLGAIRVVCAGVVAAYYWALRGTFATARSQGRCVELKWNYVGGVFIRGWSVVNC